MRRFFFSILLFIAVFPAVAQSARDFIRMGNKAYRQERYDEAETFYLKSIEKNPSFEAYYNLGNAYVMQMKDSTAYENYKKADSLGTSDPLRKARNFHNMGNIWYAQGLAASRQEGANAAGAFQNSVNYFKSSLRCNPDDHETRYNLAMAQYQLKKNQDKMAVEKVKTRIRNSKKNKSSNNRNKKNSRSKNNSNLSSQNRKKMK
jgi:Ca-activated chloride channel family protein